MHGLLHSMLLLFTLAPCVLSLILEIPLTYVSSHSFVCSKFVYIICTLISLLPLFYLFQQSLFLLSIVVNLVLNDLTSKPRLLRLPIFKLIVAIAWNILAVLLLLCTFSISSFIDFGVQFFGVSSLDASSNDIPMFFICKPKSIYDACPSADLGLFYELNDVAFMKWEWTNTRAQKKMIRCLGLMSNYPWEWNEPNIWYLWCLFFLAIELKVLEKITRVS
jgi:hypothetical protein